MSYVAYFTKYAARPVHMSCPLSTVMRAFARGWEVMYVYAAWLEGAVHEAGWIEF